MNLYILRALLRKEVNLLRRNPLIPRMILVMPLMVMLVIPLVANLDVKNLNVAVVDNDHSTISRRIVADMDASKELNVVALCPTHSSALKLVEDGKVDAVVSIPYDFEKDFGHINIEANGVNAMKGMLGARYVAGSIGNTISQFLVQKGAPAIKPDQVIVNRFNPTLNFHNYMIPALMVILLIIICGFLPALSLVSEKETGTIEAMNVTPVSRFTFVLSKLIPYWAVGILIVTVGMLIGRFVYGLTPQGNILNIYLAAILFSLIMSGLGVTIANNSDTLMQSIFVMFAIIIIFQLMGGLFTPISSMPAWAQYITYAVPPRYFNEIMRAIYLKGAGISDLSIQFSALTAFAAGTCLLAALTYRKRN